MRITMLKMLLLGLGSPALGHDFWIQPDRYVVGVGEAVPLSLLVGHGTARQRWGVPTDRVRRFAVISATGSTDQRAILHTQTGDDDGQLAFRTPGTHVVVLESGPALSVLPALRFNDYLKVEGLTPAITWRARAGQTQADGREYYSRRAKTLIGVGTNAGVQPHVTRPTGLKLEIVPQKNPYDLTAGEALPLLILYEGQPLSGATVKLNNLDSDAEPLAQRLTDAKGRVAFNVPQRGKWQLNVIWTAPIDNPNADFDTVFSSLSFGFAKPQ
ncbi:hypothetical protein GCM10007973_27540 [Polymorphobacter multimanifer]|uniref:Putative GH25 family protein n=1 Tax=Polymorphobacter multimanifer TaxID=1070431 RepID=A0A841LA19_9SPHN|nr:DUF4198 domain-containing protein [Polymorphobacter multimanifer]MBB6229497.1 putative GH25 family protein [Polymorphobacter multimanifer]GGI89672.1 hypothetical protein GCM10007973_27540 [Polymorphobacter multimanifer]